MAQETWYIRNNTNRSLSISDLGKAPFIDPNKSIDILRYHSKTEIDRSTVLKTLISSGRVTLTKTNSTPAGAAVSLPEQDDIDSPTAIGNQIKVTDLQDVTFDTLSGQGAKVLTVRGDETGYTLSDVSGNGGAGNLNELTDVQITGPVASRSRLLYDSDSGLWINGTNEEEISSVSSTGSTTDTTGVYLFDTSGGNITFTIPDASAINASDRMRFFKTTADANTVTVQTSGGQSIGSGTTALITKPDEGFSIISNTTRWEIIQSSRSVSKEISVSASGGGDFSTIGAALTFANALSPSETNPVSIEVSPGVYTESNPIVIPEYVQLIAEGQVFVEPDDNTAAIIQYGVTCVIDGITARGASGSGGIGFEFTNQGSNSTASIVRNCEAYDCERGFVSNSGLLNRVCQLKDCRVAATSDEPVAAAYVAINGSRMSLNGCVAIGNPSTGGLTDAFRTEDDDSFLRMLSCSARFVTNGLFMINSSQCDALSCRFTDCTDGAQISSTGSNAILDLIGCIFKDNTTLDLNVDQTTAVVELGNSIMDADKLSFATGSTIRGAFANQKENDEGLDILGELHVGRPEVPRESAFGGGDSYTRGMLVYAYNQSLDQYFNVSENARSSSGSTFGIPEEDANSALYISTDLSDGSDFLKFYGIKIDVNTALIPGSGSVVWEFWNGSSWEVFNVMETASDSPYTSNANQALQSTGSYQIRFDWRIKNSWAKNDPPSTGTNRYWVRIRIASGVTNAPAFEQFKIHSNRMEVNGDGFIEYFGLGRPLNRIPFDVNNFQAAANSPGDQDLYLSDNISIGRLENSFQNNAVDQTGLAVFLPYDIDTSCPVRLMAAFTVDGGTADGSQTIKFTIRWNTSSNGDGIYRSTGAAPTSSTGEQSTVFTYTVPASGNDVATIGYVDLSIPAAKAVTNSATGQGDLLWIGITRDASDPQDTYAGDVNLIQLTPYYCKWSNGASPSLLTS